LRRDTAECQTSLQELRRRVFRAEQCPFLHCFQGDFSLNVEEYFRGLCKGLNRDMPGYIE
jgi:hypothetical protein